MRFLCLPGAYGSSDKFQVQLAPIVKELTSDNTATFHFIHGPCKAIPPGGFNEYFGQPPYYRFIEPDQDTAKSGDDDILDRIRDFPEGETPEDTMRELMSEGLSTSHKSFHRALDYLVDIMHKDGPFDGIIGYSEGATVASTLLLHEQRRLKKKGIKPMFKYAIFFAGWPPVDPESHWVVLSDESEEMITIPTCHISMFLPQADSSLGRSWPLTGVQLAPSILTSTDPWLCTTCATQTRHTYLTTQRATHSRATRTR
ncbi:hypothetical protein RB601_002705 [Gaeumannomyces tritici]